MKLVARDVRPCRVVRCSESAVAVKRLLHAIGRVSQHFNRISTAFRPCYGRYSCTITAYRGSFSQIDLGRYHNMVNNM